MSKNVTFQSSRWHRLLFCIGCALSLAAGCGSDGGSNDGGGGSGGMGGTAGTGGLGGTAGSGGSGGSAGAGGSAGTGGQGGVGGAAGTGGAGGGTGGTGGAPIDAATSLDAIDKALADGEIDEIDALRFKVFAVFGDPRLPEAYRSEAQIEDGTQVLIALVESFDTLPVGVQDELDPFLRPPADPLSWYQLRTEATQAPKASYAPKAVTFQAFGAVNDKVLIQWPASQSNLQTDAEKVRAIMEGTDGTDGVWGQLTALMGREPLSDQGIQEDYNGGDGAFDIYVIEDSNVTTPRLKTAFGWTSPYETGATDNAYATYLVVNRDRIANAAAPFNTKLKSNLAHEFMHVLQFTYNVARSWSDYAWLQESTSTWAEHYVFPSDNVEQEDADNYLDDPDIALSSVSGNHEYGAYLYWFFLTEQPGGNDSIIPGVWELAESQGSLEAANSISPGGFTETFREFAAANWNRATFNQNSPYDVYDNDGLAEMASVTQEQPMASPEQVLEVQFERGGVSRLSAQYVHYDFQDANTRSLLFANGYTFNLAKGIPPSLQGAFGDETYYATQLSESQRTGRQVVALVKQNGTWKSTPYDLTDVAFAPFCQEATSESLEELVLIFINAEHREDRPFFAIPTGDPPQLFASNMGCGAWKGTGSASELEFFDDGFVDSNLQVTNVRFTRDTLSLEQIAAGAAQLDFGTETIPAGALPGVPFAGGTYTISDFDATWTFDAASGQGSPTVCQESGSGMLDESNLFSSTFSVSPTLQGSAGSNMIPSIYRSFFVQVLVTTLPSEPVMGVCSGNNPSQYTDPFASAIAGGYRNSEFGNLTVNSSGNRINESWSLDAISFTLDLTSEKIP